MSARVRAFTESSDFSNMIARKARRDPEVQLAGFPFSEAVKGLFFALIGFLALSLIRWLFEWSLPWQVLLMYCVGLALIGIFKELYSRYVRKVEKIAVGTVEKQYVSPTEKSGKNEGHFLFVFTTAENATKSHQVDLEMSNRIMVGDVGVLIVQAAKVRGFWRSDTFSN
jgi:uncharacterized membrane protein